MGRALRDIFALGYLEILKLFHYSCDRSGLFASSSPESMLVKASHSVLTSLLAAGIGVSTPVLPNQIQTPASISNSLSSSPVGVIQPLRDRLEQLWQDQQVSFILAGLIGSSYLWVLWSKPIWLLKIPSTDISMPWTTWTVPLGLVRALKYRNRVLDAWVKRHWPVAYMHL